MIYCMSDIHGDMDRYLSMLRKIQFSDLDFLYIIGDIIDRGENGVDIALDIMARKNMLLLRGNHEQMCIDDLRLNKSDALERWMRNGGGVTRDDLLVKRDETTRSRILNFFSNTPTCLEITVQGKIFHLVHGMPSDSVHDRLWGRPTLNGARPLPHATAIIGHTRTKFFLGPDYFPLRIWHGDGLIDIDCGCGSAPDKRCLGCLRLDDMQEFYV